ncbi:ATP-dependent helicase/nuclease subunit A [bioreactor metagenome]|uniref:ATP-dependent helicase/nuclease subunit A n=1 Tax=bioreactor metagenome TaxID=1076179 RepID=A0A645AML0_9ZZZZ
MISYLRLLADAKDKTALLSVLVSFYQFSDDQLAALTMHNSDLIEALTELYPDVMADIRRLQALSLEATIGQLFNEISQINDYYEKSNNEQQRANIDLLYDTILSFSLKSNSIQEFLRLVEQLSSNDLNEATAISENDDVVKIMTIHQSKGLQFKQVFFFSINRRSNPGHKSLAALNSSLGLALPVCDSPYRYSRKDIINTVINEKENTEETDEKIRVLYVALTRAQNRLYIVDQLPKETDTAISYQLLTANSYTSWMLAALPKIDPQLYLVKQINQYPAVSAAVRKISEAYQYPRYHGDKPLPLILTPSETETNDPYFDLDLQPQIKADVIGTQLHKLLEQLPDRRWQDEELLSLMTPELMPFMDGIKAFKQSELYQKFSRMTIMKEVPFAINDDRKIIHGYIDLLAEDEQEAIIVDFKTDRHTDPAALIGRYQTQLSLYARAVAMIYPHKKVTAYIYAVTLKSFVLIPNH